MTARDGGRADRVGFWGETTAFLALFLDNVGVLIFLSAILVFTFNYPADIVLTRMIPGTAVGVFCGDLVYTWLAMRLRKRTGRTDVTAMPLGLDTPSTIGIAYAVLGPAYLATRDAQLTWHIGMATLFLIGVVKILASCCGAWIQRIIPTAGLLGPLAGIGFLLLGFLPLLEIFKEAIVGLTALGIIFAVLIARLELPGRLPGILVAVVLGTIIHLILGYGGYLPEFRVPSLEMKLSIPVFSLEFLKTLPQSLPYLPIAIPFGIMTIIGGINNTESARLAGDDYRTRDILLTEAFTSLIAAFFGGVAQTTPYIGHPAYKKMGAKWRYTLLTGILIGVGAMIGLLSLLVALIPRAVLAPIFLFVGFEMIRQAYAEAPAPHAPAVSLSMLPVAASMTLIVLGQFLGALDVTPAALPLHLRIIHLSLTMLGNGFIITGLLWGSMLALLIDGRVGGAALSALTCALCTLVGIIHSVLPNGEVYLPWQIDGNAHYFTAAGYLSLAGLFSILRRREAGEPGGADPAAELRDS